MRLFYSVLLFCLTSLVYAECKFEIGDTVARLDDSKLTELKVIQGQNTAFNELLEKKQSAAPASCDEEKYKKWQIEHLTCSLSKLNSTIELTETPEGVNDQWFTKNIENKNKLIQCYETAISGLTFEKEGRAEVGNQTLRIAEIDASITGLKAQNIKLKSELAKLEEQRKDGFEGLIARLEEKNKDKAYLTRILSDSNVQASVFVGLNLMPKYDDDGKNEGFEEANIFARLNIDLRGIHKSRPAQFQERTQYWRPSYHIGVTAEFKSENTFDCEKRKSATGDTSIDCSKDIGSLDSLDFNEVSHTLTASTYGIYNFWQSRNGGAEIGVSGRFGLQSREQQKDNGDSINRFHYAGLRWTGYDFFWPEVAEKNGEKGVNGLPMFYLEFLYADLEDYAGLGQSYRQVFNSAYRPYTEKPFFVGMEINGGEGPDMISLFFMYGINPSKVADLF